MTQTPPLPHAPMHSPHQPSSTQRILRIVLLSLLMMLLVGLGLCSMSMGLSSIALIPMAIGAGVLFCFLAVFNVRTRRMLGLVFLVLLTPIVVALAVIWAQQASVVYAFIAYGLCCELLLLCVIAWTWWREASRKRRV